MSFNIYPHENAFLMHTESFIFTLQVWLLHILDSKMARWNTCECGSTVAMGSKIDGTIVGAVSLIDINTKNKLLPVY